MQKDSTLIKFALTIVLMLMSIHVQMDMLNVRVEYINYVDSINKEEIKDNEQEEQLIKGYDKKYQLTMDDYYINKLVELIWCEDRTSVENAKDVLSVIINRAKSNNVKDMLLVASQRYQFSCFNNQEILEKQRTSIQDIEMKGKIKELIIAAINGEFVPTHIGTHYYAYNKIKKPKWANKMVVVKRNNNHIFLAKLEERS
jgi:hypothetical protein